MPFLRRRRKIPATGQVTIRVTVAQRDLLLGVSGLSRELGHRLHRAPVHKGRLETRLTASELDSLISAAAGADYATKDEERALDAFLGYLEDQADRFESAPAS